jgi:subtilisin family serine protease
MATTQKLLTTPITTHEPIRWKGQEVYKYYPRLKSFLTTNMGEEYANFFARPQVRRGSKGRPEILWLSDDLGAGYAEGSAAEGDKGAMEMEEVFRAKIVEWKNGSSEETDWATLLELCLDNSQGGKIFSDGKTDVLAGWALRPLRAVTGSPFGRSIPTKAPAGVSPPVPSVALPILASEGPSTAPASAPQDPVPPTTENPSAIEPENVPESASVSKSSESMTEEPPASEPPRDKGFFARYWWLLLLLALLLGGLIWWLTRPPVAPLLPEKPNVLVPIDSTDIGMDEDSNAMVVTNRINVLLRPPKKDMEAFARDFKAAYPGPDYQVIYYDTMLARLQLIVPETERTKIMEELDGRLPEYDLLIFPESIYENQARPSDPGFRNREVSWYFDVIDAEPAWDISYGSDRVIVAIVDDGCDLNHPEFKDRIVRPYNVISRGPGVYGGAKHQHGTHVAGTAVAARNNKEGLAGIAPDCLLMPIQVADRSGQLPSTAIVDGVLYAINNGAKVINLSLGKQFSPFLKHRPRAYQEQMIRQAFVAEAAFWAAIFAIAEENGVSVVCAAGNDEVLAGIDPMQRSALSINVSALGRNGRRAKFSNYGDYSTISAPGVDIYSSIPGSTYKLMPGTSMAAPMVTGAVALAKSVNPNLTPKEIRELLVSTARPDDPSIGPTLQLGAFVQAANAAAGNTNPPTGQPDECDDINRQIEDLQRQIEDLKEGCDDYSATPDTMKMTPKPDDLDFTIGSWKSTTPINNIVTGEQLTLFFRFLPDQTGELTILEPSGNRCSSGLLLRRNQRELSIRQPTPSVCRADNSAYPPYTFTCSPDASGTVICEGVNQRNSSNRLTFKLVKVN